MLIITFMLYQGMKKGVVEIADGIVVTKADGDLYNTALLARAEYARALTLFHPKNLQWKPKVLVCSSQKKQGINDIIEMIDEFMKKMTVIDTILPRTNKKNLSN